MGWVDLWSDLFEILTREPNLTIVDEGWRRIFVEDAQGVLQDGVYAGHFPMFERTWSQGERALRILIGTAHPLA